MKRLSLEVMLSLIAAIGGTIAGIGGFIIAFYQVELDAVQRSPAVSLSCRPEFRLVELAQSIRPPDDTLLLTESGGQWVHVGGTLALTKGSPQPAAPEPFARCTVSNFGRLPVLNVRMPLHLTFKEANGGSKTAEATADIPGLAAGASYDFSMLNGSSKSLAFAYDPQITLTRVDTHAPGPAPLFRDERVAEMERHAFGGTLALAPSAPLTIVLQNFAFKPAVLHVHVGATVAFANHDDEAHSLIAAGNVFASGAIDPHTDWKHTFAKAGRYQLHCDYHPYMQATVIVE